MRKQSGFTLIEIAIVLVIIGLLLGGILKGQELINSAKVKNFAQDFRTVPIYIYGYQDKFKVLPGDDAAVATHLGAAASVGAPAGTLGNGIIDGRWDSATATDESVVFWQHVRLAGLAPGETVVSVAAGNTYIPRNADGGQMGVQSIATTNASPILGMTGSFVVCSKGIVGKFVLQLDTTLDDGNTTTGSMRATADAAAPAAAGAAAETVANINANPGTPYTVCMAF